MQSVTQQQLYLDSIKLLTPLFMTYTSIRGCPYASSFCLHNFISVEFQPCNVCNQALETRSKMTLK